MSSRSTSTASQRGRPAVTVFAPDTLLSVTIETAGEGDQIHLHPAGQGVWVARMAAELGARPILCCLLGGETGRTLEPLLDAMAGERRIIPASGDSGSYVVDRREGERRVLAASLRPVPRRHEVDDLLAASCAAALGSRVLVLCNPYPPGGVPLEAYDTLAADVAAAGVPVIADLSSPRLERVLPARPALVKINDWELAECINGPVDGPRALDAAHHLLAAGARAVAVTRAGAPILVAAVGQEPFEVVPPAFSRGHREGCGDTMTGAVAAAWARGLGLRDALVLGAAAGSVNFLRHGLGTGRRAAVEEMAQHITVRPPVASASAAERVQMVR